MRRLITLMALTLLLMLTMVGTASANNHQVTICHATGSESNPYVVVQPAKKQISEDNGHRTGEESVHPDDIIPPFEAGEHGEGENTWDAFAGQNWDAEGQEIWNNGCVAPEAEEPEGEAPADEEPADEAPSDETPSGEAPEDEAPVDETPGEANEEEPVREELAFTGPQHVWASIVALILIALGLGLRKYGKIS